MAGKVTHTHLKIGVKWKKTRKATYHRQLVKMHI